MNIIVFTPEQHLKVQQCPYEFVQSFISPHSCIHKKYFLQLCFSQVFRFILTGEEVDRKLRKREEKNCNKDHKLELRGDHSNNNALIKKYCKCCFQNKPLYFISFWTVFVLIFAVSHFV